VTPIRTWGRDHPTGARSDFEENGYHAAPGFVDPAVCDRIVAEAERFYAHKGVTGEKADRTMNLHQESPTARSLLTSRRLTRLVRELLGAKPFFLQSIYFNNGSQQNPHSDYMFMSTRPEHQLVGVWIACEDVRDGAGPLVYYPGSHKIRTPHIEERYAETAELVSNEIGSREAELRAAYQERIRLTGESLFKCVFYDRWSDELHSELERGGYEPQRFLADKGDLIVWHANLVHGGSPVSEPGATRKSLVAHYLTRQVTRYTDMDFVDRQHALSLNDIDRSRAAVLQTRD
jgi:ectoine hydroxylase-related dioxygenase (phytanoyl-CoA dioxygenase family)